MGEGEKMPTANRVTQNAREPLLSDNDAWAGPFTAGDCSVNTEAEIEGAAVFDVLGQPFVLVDADTCTNGKRGALERAEYVAGLLNRQQRPVQAEVPLDDRAQLPARIVQLLDETLCTGSALALAQSLKALASAAADDGREGHAVVARRAERFVRVMHMHVTRLLLQPDCMLRHASLDFDLKPLHVDVSDVGGVEVACSNHIGEGWHTFPLDELVTAGMASDASRIVISALTTAMVQDALGQLIERGGLPGIGAFTEAQQQLRQQGEDEPTREVHHLQVHDEYVMGSGTHTEPSPKRPDAVGFEPPEGDPAFGHNGS